MLHFIDDATAELPPARHKNAIVSIVIGELYQKTWERVARASWEKYAAQCELDLIIIRVPLDTSLRAVSRSPAWQKLLILSQPWSARYERIIWLDCDIIISPKAQNIVPYVPDAHKIGVSISNSRLSEAEEHIYFERLYGLEMRANFSGEFARLEHEKIFDHYGIHTYTHMYNTGVLVLSPVHHAALFAEVYGVEHIDRLYEQPMLSKRIDDLGLAEIISPRFNWGMIETIALYVPAYFNAQLSDLTPDDLALLTLLLRKEFKNAYFLHFYGAMGLMQCIDPPLETFL